MIETVEDVIVLMMGSILALGLISLIVIMIVCIIKMMKL